MPGITFNTLIKKRQIHLIDNSGDTVHANVLKHLSSWGPQTITDDLRRLNSFQFMCQPAPVLHNKRGRVTKWGLPLIRTSCSASAFRIPIHSGVIELQYLLMNVNPPSSLSDSQSNSSGCRASGACPTPTPVHSGLVVASERPTVDNVNQSPIYCCKVPCLVLRALSFDTEGLERVK